MKWLHYNRSEGCNELAMDYAAKKVEIRKQSTFKYPSQVIDNAALNGHFDVVRWLYYNRTEGCNLYLIDSPRPEISKWLKNQKKV